MSTKRYIVVVNPKGGTRRGLDALERVKPIFAAAQAELRTEVTSHAGHAAELASALDLSRCDGLCLIGGDGTLHEVVNGLMTRKAPASAPLGIIPAGTGNTVAQHFGIGGPEDAAQRILNGRAQDLDVARVKTGDVTAYCVNIVGWGAMVDVNRMAERMRALGPPRYALAAVAHILGARPRRVRLTVEDRVIEDEFLLAAACNTKFTGKGMKLAPDADSGDGKLDLVFVRRATRGQLLTLFRKVFDGSHMSLPFVEHMQTSSLSIEPGEVDALNLDGEIKGTTPASIDVLPGALRVFV